MPHVEALQLMADSNGLMILGSNSEQRLNRKVFEYTALNQNVFYLGNIKSPTANIVRSFNGTVSSSDDLEVKFLFFLEGLSNRKLELSSAYSKDELVKKLLDELL